MLSNIVQFCQSKSLKKTLENARPARVLKPGSKSCKMIMKRPIQNIKAYESSISQFENIIVKLGVYGDLMYNNQSAHSAVILMTFKNK